MTPPQLRGGLTNWKSSIAVKTGKLPAAGGDEAGLEHLQNLTPRGPSLGLSRHVLRDHTGKPILAGLVSTLTQC